MADEDIPFDVHELDKLPEDYSNDLHTYEILAGVFVGSAIAAAAVWYLLA